MAGSGVPGSRARASSVHEPEGEEADLTETPSGLLVAGDDETSSGDDYVLPVLGARLPGGAVDTTFWIGLAGAAILGAIELPVAAALGAGIMIARHGRRS